MRVNIFCLRPLSSPPLRSCLSVKVEKLGSVKSSPYIFFIGGSWMPPRMASVYRPLGSSLTHYLFLPLFGGMFAWNQNHCFSTISPGTLAHSPAVRRFQLSVGFHPPHLPEACGWETWVLHISSVESSLSSLAWYWRPFNLVGISHLASYWPLCPLVPWADVFTTSILGLAHSSIQTSCSRSSTMLGTCWWWGLEYRALISSLSP